MLNKVNVMDTPKRMIDPKELATALGATEVAKLPIIGLSDVQIQFAKDVAKLADTHGVKRFELILQPLSLRTDITDCYISGAISIVYSSTDGRGRPCNNLTISCNASVKHVIESTPESSS